MTGNEPKLRRSSFASRLTLFWAVTLLCTAVTLVSCGEEEHYYPSVSTGVEPDQVFVEPRIIITETGVTQAIIESEVVRVYESRDTSYTSLNDSLVIDFYNDHGEHTSTLTADRGEVWGLYTNVDSLKATGNVYIRSQERNAILTAEAIRWLSVNRMVYGEGLVTLETGDGFERGYGFEAKDDLSEYRFSQSVEGELRNVDTPGGEDTR